MRARFSVTLCWALFLVASVPGAAHAFQADEPGEPIEGPRVTYWVNPTARPDGDGSEEHPFRSLTHALKRGGKKRIRLASGIYRGAFELTPGTELWGPGMRDPDAPPAEEEARTARRGGAAVLVSTGLRAVAMIDGPCNLRGLRLRGIRGGGPIVWVRTGAVELSDSQLEGEGNKGLVLDPGTAATVERVAFRGALPRAIELSEAALQGSDLKVEGEVALHSVRGKVALTRLLVAPGKGPGLFCGGGELKLREVTVRGHEYGLLTRPGCKLDVEGLWADRPERAGLALVESEGYLTHLKISEAGNYGGIQLLGSRLRIDRFTIDGAEAYGVTIRGGAVKLRSGDIRRVHDREGGAGDGIHVRTAQLELRAITLSDIAGAGLLAAEEARVEAHELNFRQVATSAIWADTGARVRIDAGKYEDLKGQWVTVPAKAWVKLVGAELRGLSDRPVVMDCQLGARLELSRVRGESLGVLPPCAR